MKVGRRHAAEQPPTMGSPEHAHAAEGLPTSSTSRRVGSPSASKPTAPDSVSSVLNQIPNDCIGVAVEIRYWNAWRATASQATESTVEYVSSGPLGELIGQPSEHLHALAEIVRTHGDRPVVTVRANKEGARELAQALRDRQIALVDGSGGLSAWTELEVVKSALEHDMTTLGRKLLNQADRVIRATAGCASVAGRDTLTRTATPTRFEQQDVLVLDDRRLLLASVDTSLDRSLVERSPRITVLDIGTPEKITVTPEYLTIRGSTREEEEVTVMLEGRRVVTGYRQVPTTLRLPEAVGVSVLMTLVALGLGGLVEQSFPTEKAPDPTGSQN